MVASRLGSFLPVLVALACSTTPPPRWEEGGAPLVLGGARWERSKQKPVEISPNGSVSEGGREILFIDRAGRIADKNREPVGILLPDGFVAGTDDTDLGRVGVTNAAPPGSATAWLAVMTNGEVVLFDSEGDRHRDGSWTGCEGAMQRTCTLVTHLVVLRNYREPQHGPVVGIGIGIGI